MALQLGLKQEGGGEQTPVGEVVLKTIGRGVDLTPPDDYIHAIQEAVLAKLPPRSSDECMMGVTQG